MKTFVLSLTLITAIGSTAVAQTNGGKLVALNLVALDSAGNTVPDLTASDISIFDNNSQQKVVNLQLKQTDGPRALVILFDMMNASRVSRGAIRDELKNSLAHLPPSDSLYLYLLVEDGSLYPVHGLPNRGSAAPQDSWQQDIGALLDEALNKVDQLKPEEIRVAVPARFNATCEALDSMRSKMAALVGPKELLWVTYGIPSSIHYPGRGWFDGGPGLRQIGARFIQSNITVYTADPGFDLEHSLLERDSLDILTRATGGRTFSTIDLNRAISQALADARSNYTLEYQPTEQNWDGKYHKLRVISTRKGVRLQSQQGYFAILGS